MSRRRQPPARRGATPPPPKTHPHAGECGPPCSVAHLPCVFRESFDNAFELLWVLDCHGNVLEVNETALAQRDLKRLEARGQPVWDGAWWDISPDARSRLKKAIDAAAKGRSTRYEVDLLGPGGGVRTYDISVKRATGPTAGAPYLLCAARDVSERKRVERALAQAREDLQLRVRSGTADFAEANERLKREVGHRQRTEAALRASEAKVRAILDTAADAILTIDERGTVTSFNPAAKRMFGYEPGEVLGRNVKMLMPDPYFSEHDRYLSSYMRTGRAKIIGIGREVVGRRKDGYTFPLDLAVSEVRVGEQRTFAGIARDITERKRLERQILEISDQEQLRIGQDLHDGLGQQLTGIAFLAKVLGEDLAADASPRAESAKKVARLVQEVISRTRDLARGLSPVGLEAQGLEPALQELARHTEELPGIRCEFVCGRSAVPDSPGGNVHLYRIAQESVNNALKHGKAKNINIQLGAVEGKGVLSIQDDGVGYRARRARRKGMGLTIMAYRARMIGASLEIRAGDPGGTVVRCTFRLASRKKR